MNPTDDPELKVLLTRGIQQGFPGVAALIQAGNGVVRSAAVGHSDLENRTPLRVGDAFHMASITKTFTATAVLRLVDQGKLSLQATIGDLLHVATQHIPHADRITVSQLLDHSSGIYATNNDVDYLATVIGPDADPSRVWDPEELVALADGDRSEPSGRPGDGHYYADTNYVLLGLVVERISGEPLRTHIARTLLDPLEMRSTYFYSDHLGKDAHPPVTTVRGYLLATDDLRSIIEIHPMFKSVAGENRTEGELLDTTLAAERIDAAGGLVTTLPELLRFASALFRGQLVSAQGQHCMMSVADGMQDEPIGTQRISVLQSIRKPYGVLVYKEGDGPGGVNTLMAYRPAADEVFLGFINMFGYFNEVEFLMDDVIGKLVASE